MPLCYYSYLIVVNDNGVGRLLVSVRERVAYRCVRRQLHSSGLNRSDHDFKVTTWSHSRSRQVQDWEHHSYREIIH